MGSKPSPLDDLQWQYRYKQMIKKPAQIHFHTNKLFKGERVRLFSKKLSEIKANSITMNQVCKILI